MTFGRLHCPMLCSTRHGPDRTRPSPFLKWTARTCIKPGCTFITLPERRRREDRNIVRRMCLNDLERLHLMGVQMRLAGDGPEVHFEQACHFGTKVGTDWVMRAKVFGAYPGIYEKSILVQRACGVSLPVRTLVSFNTNLEMQGSALPSPVPSIGNENDTSYLPWAEFSLRIWQRCPGVVSGDHPVHGKRLLASSTLEGCGLTTHQQTHDHGSTRG